MANRKRHAGKSSEPKDALYIGQLLKKTTQSISLYVNENDFEEDIICKTGSAVAINSSGHLITAAHNIKIRPDDAKGKPIKKIIMAKVLGLPAVPYSIVLDQINLDLPNLRAPLLVDLAYLRPNIHLENVPFLVAKKEHSEIGTTVLMAGYPDELEPPLSLDSHLDLTSPVLENPEHETKKKIQQMRTQLMVKHGMIGYSEPVALTPDENGYSFRAHIYYVDNGMHPGASGGPVVNMQGELIATITQRAETKTVFSDDPLPSGSTLAVSSWSIIDFLKSKGFDPDS